MLLSLIFNDQIVCLSLFKQRYSDSVLFVKVLLQKQGAQWFVYTFKFGVEGTVVKLYLFDNTWAFDVVVVAVKFKIEDFDARPLFNR